jgi:TPR repeat protein
LGNSIAQYNLASIYFNGEGDKDYNKAIELYQKQQVYLACWAEMK